MHDMYKLYQKQYSITRKENILAQEIVTRMITTFMFFPKGVDNQHQLYMTTLVEHLIYHNKFFEFTDDISLEYSKNYKYITINKSLKKCYDSIFAFNKVSVLFSGNKSVQTILSIEIMNKIQNYILSLDVIPFIITDWMLI